jgi:hypothetical protein
MSYVPKRLIDINLLQNMVSLNPLVGNPSTRLLTYVPIINNPIKSEKIISLGEKIDKIKTGGFEKIGYSLLNGLMFITVCIIIYSVLHYKYYKKKSIKS